MRIATGARNSRNSASSTPEDKHEGRESKRQVANLERISAALHRSPLYWTRTVRGQMKVCDCGSYFLAIAVPRSLPSESTAYNDQLLEVFSAESHFAVGIQRGLPQSSPA